MNTELKAPMPATSTGLLTRARDLTDRPAWERLVALYEPLLHGWLRRQDVQHADAEDLVQGVLSAVAVELQEFQHNGRTGAFRSWLRAMLVNRLRTFRRSQRVRSVCQSDSEALPGLFALGEKPTTEQLLDWLPDRWLLNRTRNTSLTPAVAG